MFDYRPAVMLSPLLLHTEHLLLLGIKYFTHQQLVWRATRGC
jgi:hypothetical protein